MPATETEIAGFAGSAQSLGPLVEGVARLNGKGRRTQKIPKMIQKLSDESKVYIFNVGPWKQNQSMGSLGTFYIPECEDGKQYSKPLAIDGLVIEHYPLRENVLDVLMDEEGSTGWEIAHQIIGIGKQLSPSNSLTRYGVFVSRSNPPAKEDVTKAREALHQHCQVLVNEANQSITEGNSRQTIDPKQHFVAARILKKTVAECPWLSRDVNTEERKSCDVCGAPYRVGNIVCPNNHIVDMAAYEKNKDRFVLAR